LPRRAHFEDPRTGQRDRHATRGADVSPRGGAPQRVAAVNDRGGFRQAAEVPRRAGAAAQQAAGGGRAAPAGHALLAMIAADAETRGDAREVVMRTSPSPM